MSKGQIDKENSLLIKTGQYLIGISSRKYKVAKIIDSERGISRLKIITLSNNGELLILFKRQLQYMKQYLMRRHQLTSKLDLTPYIEMEQKEQKQFNNTVIKIITKFYEYLTLNDYYREQTIKATTTPGRKLFNNSDASSLIYFFEQLFQLITRGGGINHFFYTPTNFFYVPPHPEGGLDHGKLILNVTSFSGLKFIYKYQIPKDEFIEIYPCLPPNSQDLIKEKQYGKLDLLIKIRSFVFNMLAYIIKRVPIFFQEALEPVVSINTFSIQKLLKRSPRTFQALLKCQSKNIEDAQASTKIDLKALFTQVLVENKIWSWKEIHEKVFMQNIYNRDDYFALKETGNSNNMQLIRQHQFYQNLVQQIWEGEENKQFYNSRAIGQKQLNVYLLVKINCNFHPMLRWLNILEYCDNQYFSEDSAKIASRLMQFTTSHHFQQLHKELHKQVLALSDPPGNQQQPAQGQAENVTPKEQAVLYDPFCVKWSKRGSKEQLQRSGPSTFLRNVFSLPSDIHQNNKMIVVTSTNNKLQVLSKFQNQMWLI